MVKLYGFCLKYCIYCASAPSLHKESTDSLINMFPTRIFIHCMVSYSINLQIYTFGLSFARYLPGLYQKSLNTESSDSQYTTSVDHSTPHSSDSEPLPLPFRNANTNILDSSEIAKVGQSLISIASILSKYPSGQNC